MKEQQFVVKENNQIGSGIFELVLSGEVSESIACGQFCNVQIPNRADLILKRPFGISKHDKDSLTVCYQVVGEGTKSLTFLRSGDKMLVTYPLGNGFAVGNSKKVLLVGGGVGVFPLLPVAKEGVECHAFLGYKSKDMAVYLEEFRNCCESVSVATDDGSLGHKGFITELVASGIEKIKPDLILSCGPMPMLNSLYVATKNYRHIKTYVSLEERMGCGVGACLVCACKIKNGDKLSNKRVCADGPVFLIEEAIF